MSEIEQQIKKKIENAGVPLKDWDIRINYGIKTGYNEAFIISTEKRDELVDKCPEAASIIRPILEGKHIKKYSYNNLKWLIAVRNGLTRDFVSKGESPEDTFANLYPSIYEHFISSSSKAGKGKGLFKRDDQGEFWWELRPCAYWQEFDTEKIVYSEIVREPQFSLDCKNVYVNDTCFIMTGKNLKYILALLNSTPVAFFYKNFYAGGGLGEEGIRYKKAFLENLPVPCVQDIGKFEILVDKITASKQTGLSTTQLELQIDELVFNLYKLQQDEIDYIKKK